MKAIFPEYYRPDAASLEEAWKTCTFMLDANILLSFYRLTAEGREDLLATLEAVKDRIWVPYHAALEYQRNKISVIADQKALIDSITTHIDKTAASLESGLSGHQMIEPGPVVAEVKRVLNQYKEKLKTLGLSQADVHDPDVIGERIDRLVMGRVGPIPDQPTIDDVEKEGETRFSSEIPPGFKDAKKTEVFYGQGLRYQARFGDLHVWKQILRKIESDKLTSVIFLSQDAKDDWWLRVKGKTIGPHPELRAEAATAGAMNFQIYALSQFLEFAKKDLNKTISNNSIRHAHELDEDFPDLLLMSESTPILRVRLVPMEENEQEAVIDEVCDKIVEVVETSAIAVNSEGDEWLFAVDGGATASELTRLVKSVNLLPEVELATRAQPKPSSSNDKLHEINIILKSHSLQDKVQWKVKGMMERHLIRYDTYSSGVLLSIRLKDRVPKFLIDGIRRNITSLEEVSHCI